MTFTIANKTTDQGITRCSIYSLEFDSPDPHYEYVFVPSLNSECYCCFFACGVVYIWNCLEQRFNFVNFRSCLEQPQWCTILYIGPRQAKEFLPEMAQWGVVVRPENWQNDGENECAEVLVATGQTTSEICLYDGSTVRVKVISTYVWYLLISILNKILPLKYLEFWLSLCLNVLVKFVFIPMYLFINSTTGQF